MWCWSSSPSSWLGGRHGSLILEWWASIIASFGKKKLYLHEVLINNTSQIPLETKAKEIWGAAPQRPNYSEDERTPLLAGGGEGGMLARYLLCLDYSKQSNNHKTSKDEAKTLIPFILMFVATFSVKEWWLLGLHPTSPDLVLAWHALGSSGQDPSSFLLCLCLTFADMWRGVHCMRAVWGISTHPLRVQTPQMTMKRWATFTFHPPTKDISYNSDFK